VIVIRDISCRVDHEHSIAGQWVANVTFTPDGLIVVLTCRCQLVIANG
jgi:hypothetical protein